MLASAWKTDNKKKDTTTPSYITVSWTNNVARFCETTQLVDVVDCFGLVYGTPSSATSAQNRFLGKKVYNSTESAMKVSPGTMMWKVKWAGDKQGRLAMKVNHMRDFLTMFIVDKMPKASSLVDVLDVEELTAVNACTAITPLVCGSNAQIRGETTLNTTNDGVTCSSIGREQIYASVNSAKDLCPDVLKRADAMGVWNVTINDVAQRVAPRRMEETYSLMLKVTDAESESRLVVANTRKEKALKEKEHNEENLRKRKAVDDELEDYRLKTGKKIETIAYKIKKMEELGMTAEASKLKEELVKL